MATCKIVIQSETNCKIENLDLSTRKKLVKTFSYDIPGARFTPAVRLGRWDGKKSFCSLAGQTYLNLLPEILPILESEGYDIDLDDLRDYNTQFEFTAVAEDSYAHIMWPVGHNHAGKPIMLRDYQVDSINASLSNTQSMSCLSTASGKCLAAETELELLIDENSPFGKYLLSTLQQGAESDVTRSIR